MPKIVGENEAREGVWIKRTGGGSSLPPVCVCEPLLLAYGTVMVVPSPVALTVNVPAAAFGAYV